MKLVYKKTAMAVEIGDAATTSMDEKVIVTKFAQPSFFDDAGVVLVRVIPLATGEAFPVRTVERCYPVSVIGAHWIE